MPTKEVLEDRFNTLKNLLDDNAILTTGDLKRIVNAMAKNDEEEIDVPKENK
jgi:hypothetical protein